MTDGTTVVQLSLRPPDGTTQFVDLLLEGAPEEVEYRFFTWRRALAGDYDVFHVHWPELIIRDSRGAWRRWLKRRLLDGLILRLRAQHRPIVRTFHNPRPHERGDRAENRSLDRLDRATALHITLNEHTAPGGGARTVTIPHGHYAGAFARYPQPNAVPGRVLYFGIIRPYKNVEALATAFAGLDDPALSLHIVGDPHQGQRAVLERAASLDPRIALDLRFVDDATLVREVREASLVVLPYLDMKNSGALLVALSLRRPALVPASPVNLALADEFGHDWVRTFEGDLDAPTLRAHLDAVQRLDPAAAPAMQGRDAATLGRAHLEAYRAAQAAVR